MTEFGFLVSYAGRAWVTVEAESIEEAREKLYNESCALEDHANVQNSLFFEVFIEKESEHD